MALVLNILRETLSCSWLNTLLIFVPFGYVSYLRNFSPTLTFLFNSLAIVPLSTLLTESTERIARESGDVIGAFLNISLGNLVELILLFALKNDQVRVVQLSILGSILVNLLLILGSALLACGLPDQEFAHHAAGTQLLGSLLFVSVFAFLMPTAFDYTSRNNNGTERASLHMTRASAVMIFLIYVVYFIHEVKHKHHATQDDTLSTLTSRDEESNLGTLADRRPIPPADPALNSHTLLPRTVRFAEDDDDAAIGNQIGKVNDLTELRDLEFTGPDDADDETALIEGRIGKPSIATPAPSAYALGARPRSRSQSLSHGSNQGAPHRDSFALNGEASELIRPYLTTRNILGDSRLIVDGVSTAPNRVARKSTVDRVTSIIVLLVTSGLMSLSAEFLGNTIDKVTRQGHISETFIGLIILPIVGNVAEYATVVTVAARDKMGLALAVSVGSAIQIALCVTPLTIIAAWTMNRPLVLAFNFFEISALVGSVVLVNFLILGEGMNGPLRSSGLKGGLICACYAIITLGAYLS